MFSGLEELLSWVADDDFSGVRIGAALRALARTGIWGPDLAAAFAGLVARALRERMN
jgi:hypothetical protein